MRRCMWRVLCSDFRAGLRRKGWDPHMKNTGKRIFFAVVAFVVVNAGVVVVAGALTSSR